MARPVLAAPDLTQAPYLAPPDQATSPRITQTVPENSPAQANVASTSRVLEVELRPLAPDAVAGTGTPGLPDGIGSDEAVPMFRVEPDYPRKAARAGKEGWVKIEFTINEQGKVVDAVVVDAEPRRIFNRSALTAIRKWQFRPRVDNGQPVSRRASQVIEFKLANR